MKYLIIGAAWVGDMIMSQTLFTFVKQNDPAAIIDVVAPKATVALVELMPEIRQGIVLESGHGDFNLFARYHLGKKLRAEKYDQVLVIPNSWKSALIPFFAKIPRRTGWLGEQRYMLLNDWRKLNKEKYPLMIQRLAALAITKNATLPQKLPYPKLTITSAMIDAALEKTHLSKPTKPILALCPGAEFGPAKRWPPEYYAEVAAQKLAEGYEVWLFGSPKEAEAAEVIQQHTQQRCVNLVGKTKLLDAVALMSLATAVVTNDSGLMHIAAALDKPLVAIYGSSSPQFTPPLSDKVMVLSLGLDCSPCFQRECPLGHLNCLKKLPASMVLQALSTIV